MDPQQFLILITGFTVKVDKGGACDGKWNTCTSNGSNVRSRCGVVKLKGMSYFPVITVYTIFGQFLYFPEVFILCI